jgi:hypothetical protein
MLVGLFELRGSHPTQLSLPTTHIQTYLSHFKCSEVCNVFSRNQQSALPNSLYSQRACNDLDCAEHRTYYIESNS